jgi:DNA invertase Pin-like site-specific DNA recombinase
MVAAVYVRKSTEQNGVADEQRSVTRQIENASAFAASKGWTVREEFIFADDGVSGAETIRLRERARMIEAASKNAFDVVIMQAQDRFSRRDGDEAFGELKQLARHVAVWFYADGQKFEAGTFASNTLGFLKAEFAAEYRRAIAAKTHEALLRKVKAGHVVGGRLFGYDNLDVHGHAGGQRSHVQRQINETEAAIVRRIFELSVTGHGVKAIAKRLNADRVPAPRSQGGRSQSWAPSSVRAVLHRDVYRGVVTWNRTKKRNPSGSQQQAARPAGDWLSIPAPTLRIVDEMSGQPHMLDSMPCGASISRPRAGTGAAGRSSGIRRSIC